MTELQTTKDVIDELGGTPGIRKLTGAKPKAISAWRTSNRLPWKVYPVVAEALAKQGKTVAPTLWGMKATETAA